MCAYNTTAYTRLDSYRMCSHEVRQTLWVFPVYLIEYINYIYNITTSLAAHIHGYLFI